jgi:hypothetical protein
MMAAAGSTVGQNILSGITDFASGYGNPPNQPGNVSGLIGTYYSVFNDWLSLRR